MRNEPIYMSAEQLGLTDAEHAGLLRLKGELERGELRHVTEYEVDHAEDAISGALFNMEYWTAVEYCGTVCCIGGWLEQRGQLRARKAEGLPLCPKGEFPPNLHALFYPPSEIFYGDITPAQAARAIGNLLRTGEPRWAEAVS